MQSSSPTSPAPPLSANNNTSSRSPTRSCHDDAASEEQKERPYPPSPSSPPLFSHIHRVSLLEDNEPHNWSVPHFSLEFPALGPQPDTQHDGSNATTSADKPLTEVELNESCCTKEVYAVAAAPSPAEDAATSTKKGSLSLRDALVEDNCDSVRARVQDRETTIVATSDMLSKQKKATATTLVGVDTTTGLCADERYPRRPTFLQSPPTDEPIDVSRAPATALRSPAATPCCSDTEQEDRGEQQHTSRPRCSGSTPPPSFPSTQIRAAVSIRSVIRKVMVWYLQPEKKCSEREKSLILIYCSISAGAGIFAGTLFAPAMYLVQQDLQTTTEQIQLTYSLFFASSAIAPIFMGFIGDVWGRKALLLLSHLIGAMSSFVLYTSSTITDIIIFRTIQGIYCAMIGIAAAGIVADIFEEERHGTALGWVLLGIALGPSLGPVFGGAISQYAGDTWHSVFLVTALMALVLMMLGFLVPETEPQLLALFSSSSSSTTASSSSEIDASVSSKAYNHPQQRDSFHTSGGRGYDPSALEQAHDNNDFKNRSDEEENDEWSSRSPNQCNSTPTAAAMPRGLKLQSVSFLQYEEQHNQQHQQPLTTPLALRSPSGAYFSVETPAAATVRNNTTGVQQSKKAHHSTHEDIAFPGLLPTSSSFLSAAGESGDNSKAITTSTTAVRLAATSSTVKCAEVDGSLLDSSIPQHPSVGRDDAGYARYPPGHYYGPSAINDNARPSRLTSSYKRPSFWSSVISPGKVLCTRVFLCYGLPSSYSYAAYLYLLSVLSRVYGRNFGFNVITTGLLFLPLGAGLMAGSRISGVNIDKFGAQRVCLVFSPLCGVFFMLLCPFLETSLPGNLIFSFMCALCASASLNAGQVILMKVFPNNKSAALSASRFGMYTWGFICVQLGAAMEGSWQVSASNVVLIYGVAGIGLSLPLMISSRNDVSALLASVFAAVNRMLGIGNGKTRRNDSHFIDFVDEEEEEEEDRDAAAAVRLSAAASSFLSLRSPHPTVSHHHHNLQTNHSAHF